MSAWDKDLSERGGSQPLAANALATHLLQLGARGASGRLMLGGRVLVLRQGRVADVLAAPQDESLAQQLQRAGRSGTPTGMELRHLQRTLVVERLARALRAGNEGREGPTTLEHAPDTPLATEPLPLAPLLLDALARAGASADAGVVGAHLNHRIEWLSGVHRDAAQEWADFGEGPQRPAVSTVLAKRPAAAPRIAALLRAGLLRLDPPGRAAPSEPPAPGTLPPPPPRLPAIPDLSQPEQRLSLDLPAAIASIRPPRLRLDPGHAVASAAPLEPTRLPSLPVAEKPLDDPLFAIERRIAELEAKGAQGPERARAFAALADGWRGRYGSIERACRAFREAAAADPTDRAMLYQAAAHCRHMGDGELAARYAIGAVAAAGIPIERAEAQLLLARIERSAGHVEACVEALCEAAADDPESPEPHEQVATLLLERGQADGANAHIRLAATALDDDTNERALALLAWAFSLKPGDAPTAYEYASLLDASGRRAGAVAVLTDCAAHCLDHEQVRKLRLAAAERAESARRPDIAAETLVDAFDADPHFDMLYGPLDEDLQALGVPEYHAVVLEDIATACAEEQRAHWLTLAGKAMLRVEGQHEAGLRLLFEALLTAPRNEAALQALRVHAHSRAGLTLLAHGLRAAIAASIEDQSSGATPLLTELADIAETGLGNPHLAHAALTQLERLSPAETTVSLAGRGARLQQQIDARHAELQEAERSLAGAEASARAGLCQRVALLLPDLPDHWPRRIDLLETALAAGHAPSATREEIEGLLGLRRDVIGLATFLEDQADITQDRTERVRLLTRLCELHAVREDIPAIAATCETLLAIDPSCRIAVARFERAARKLGEPGLLARALS
ncbi:MAG: tetratricopeptide repeat protein, partial [Polyangiales bacterium]